MTTKFIEPDWKGKTVVVLAGGPSFNVPLAESLRHHVTLAVNFTGKLVPWVDAILCLDGDVAAWNDIMEGYVGIKMCGTPSDKIDGMFVGSGYETIKLALSRTVELRNSGLAAIRIAARCGASRIILVGFDPETHSHAEGYPPMPGAVASDPYPHMAEGLASVIASVRASGVAVEFAEPLTTIPVEFTPVGDVVKAGMFSKRSRNTA